MAKKECPAFQRFYIIRDIHFLKKVAVGKCPGADFFNIAWYIEILKA